MISRELTDREKEILEMIRPTTFQDIVDTVRRDVEQSKYDAKRELRNLHNGIKNINGVESGITGEIIMSNDRNKTNNIDNRICEVSI